MISTIRKWFSAKPQPLFAKEVTRLAKMVRSGHARVESVDMTMKPHQTILRITIGGTHDWIHFSQETA
jgi:hypothetical protein